jgi:pimeloyl-ACP methyl ester carboxylesterase
MQYEVQRYAGDMLAMLQQLHQQAPIDSLDWVGTSMGGLIGMALAAQEGTPIRKLVLNDVGPVITAESLHRIGTYVGTDPDWATFEEALAFVKFVSAPFGALTEAQWHHLTETSVMQRPDGRWVFRYDPRIAEPFRAAFADQDVNLWPLYEQIKTPTLVIRGAESDLLTRDTWEKMGSCGPLAKLAEIEKVGHAPMFQSEDQIAIVRNFLLSA